MEFTGNYKGSTVSPAGHCFRKDCTVHCCQKWNCQYCTQRYNSAQNDSWQCSRSSSNRNLPTKIRRCCCCPRCSSDRGGSSRCCQFDNCRCFQSFRCFRTIQIQIQTGLKKNLGSCHPQGSTCYPCRSPVEQALSKSSNLAVTSSSSTSHPLLEVGGGAES